MFIATSFITVTKIVPFRKSTLDLLYLLVLGDKQKYCFHIESQFLQTPKVLFNYKTHYLAKGSQL